MFTIGTNVEARCPKARKWIKGTIVDMDEATLSFTIAKPSGIEFTVGTSKVREIDGKTSEKKAAKPKQVLVEQPENSCSAELHADLQQAFNHFNRELFGDRLPKPFWVTVRKRSVLAHYAYRRWAKGENGGNGENVPELRDEININPDYMVIRGLEDFLSSIVHEMMHMWQFHQGTPSRAGYHNAEWAEKMEAVGLVPSNTGKEGGKKTGQKMDHYIIDGSFKDAAKDLTDGGFKLRWTGAVAEVHGGEGTKFVPSVGPRPSVGKKPARKAPTRVRFDCPDCGQKSWAKPSANLKCGNCDALMLGV